MRRRTGLRKDKGVFAAMRLHEVLKCTTVLVVFGGLFSIPAYANPQGGTVVAGGASIAGEGTSRVTVMQTTDRAIINWNSFSIGANERTDFVQPSVGAIALNRVVGVNPSEILGTLTATGQLVLVNPNGILFGKGATVDAAGLVATTHDVDDRQFMSGGPLRFNDGRKAGASVVNQGTITIRDAGIAAFVAPHVRNAGIIQANLGTVALASARGFTLDLYGDQLISFEIGDKIAETLTTADGTPLKALVSNDGTIDVAGGRIYLTAEAAREVVNQSLNLSGIVRADSVMQDGGAIVLSGSGTVAVETGAVVSASGVSGGSVKVAAGDFATDGTVRADGSAGAGGSIAIEARAADIGGKISASGATVGGAIAVQAEDAVATSAHYAADGGDGVGGRIDVTGRSVAIDAATFSAIGTDRGGLVRIGGAFQGGKTPDANQPYHDSFVGRWGELPEIAAADRTSIDEATSIDVSSSAGIGGTAIVWSSDQTTFLGSINARGTVSGGAVEISAANDLNYVDLMRLEIGRDGYLLLDPKDIAVGVGAPYDPINDDVFYDESSSTSNVSATSLAALLTSTNVVLQASNDITVTSQIIVPEEGHHLTLQAGRSVVINSNINTANGDLTLIANDYASNGVHEEHRVGGNAAITMGNQGTFINAGTGTVTIDLRAGTGRSGNQDDAGFITLRDITAGRLSVTHAGSNNATNSGNIVIEENVTISVSGQGIPGESALFMEAKAGQILIKSGASLRSTYAGPESFDAITLRANLDNAATANFSGIYLDSGALIETALNGSGNILLEGRGGKGEGSDGRGLRLSSNAKIQSLGHGTVTLTGYGASAGGTSRHGILVEGAEISSAYGDISITGYGGASLHGNQTGVAITNGAKISSTGSGEEAAVISIEGYGGVGAGALSNMRGVLMEGVGVAVESIDGDITITGLGGPNTTSENSFGVVIRDQATVKTTGAARIAIEGTGGGTTDASKAYGILLESSAVVTSEGSGNIDITGNGGINATGSENYGVYIGSGAQVVSAVSGHITVDGKGGTSGADRNYGIFLTGGLIETRGSGNVLLEGTGGGAGANNYGVHLNNYSSGGIETLSSVLAEDTGAITINGFASATGNSIATGILMANSTSVQSALGRIDITGYGGGSLIGNDHRGISLLSGTAVESADGIISLIGYGGVNTNGTGAHGILISAASVKTTGTGSIAVNGIGGGGAGASESIGVRMQGVGSVGAVVQSISGGIEITGSAGANATGNNNRGIVIVGTETALTAVESADGSIVITGHGGAQATSTEAYGVQIQTAKIESTGEGAITIDGTGGGGIGASSAHGVRLAEKALVQSAKGDIAIIGSASIGATGGSNFGVYIEPLSKVISTTSAAIIISGQGGTSGNDGNHGAYIFGTVESQGSGDILIEGVGGGSAGTNHGLNFAPSARVGSAEGHIALVGKRGSGGLSRHFYNQAGTALILDDSVWVAYLPDHEHNSYGALASGNLPVWGKTIDDLSPAEATAEGNRYVFANAPTLNVSTNFSDSKTYGEVYAFATPVLGTHYQLAFVDAAQYGDVWVQETAENTGVTGAPVLSSDGTVAAARVADGPYDITIAQGTLANTAGYVFGGFTSTGKLTVAPKTLTVDGVLAQNKVYDATRNAVLVFTTDDVINDDDVTFSYTALFDDKKVGNGKSITVDGIVTLAGADASNYTLSLDADLLDGLEANITPATLVLGGSFTASDKVYDATPVAQIDAGGLSIVSGLVGGDDVAILATGATGEFADKNVGNGKVVTLATDGSGVLDGDDAGNYVIDTSGLAVVTANITPATLTITGTFTVDGKVYDGTTDATIVTNNLVLSGVFGGDDVDLIAVAAFLDKNAGNGKVVDLSGSSLDGFDADNYVLNFTGAPTATANIARRTITVTADAQTKEYGDADPTLTFTIGGLGLAAGETVSDVFTGALQRDPGEDVGTYAVSQGSLTANDNYEITTFTGADLRIDPATLTVIVDDKTRLQGEPNPVFTYVVTGYKFGDDESVISGLSVETSAEATSPAGTYAIKAWGATAMNYVFNYIDGVLTVLPANENPDIRELDNQQLAMLNQGQELAGDSLGTPESGRTINVALTDEGLIAAPGIGRTSSESLSGQASIAGSGSIAACTAGTSINSAVSNIVNVDTGSGVYCASSALPGIVR